MTHSATTSPSKIDTDAPLPASRYVVYFAIAAAGALLDLWTKHAVFQWRGIPKPGHEWWIVENYFGIESATNPGALFGIGAGGSTIFAGMSIVAALGILLWLFLGKAARDWWLTIALACVTAGILGNLYDRLGFGMTEELHEQYVAAGYSPEEIDIERTSVRDWILFRWKTKTYTWPNFNIADMLLVGGAGTLVWRSFKKPVEKT